MGGEEVSAQQGRQAVKPGSLKPGARAHEPMCESHA